MFLMNRGHVRLLLYMNFLILVGLLMFVCLAVIQFIAWQFSRGSQERLLLA